MRKTIFSLLFLLAGFSGCRVGPQYEPPCSIVPEEWKFTQQTESTCLPDVCNWWEVFEDERLNELELQAIDNNPNLDVAMARIKEAWAQAGINLASLYPQLTLDPSYTNTGLLFKIFLPNLGPLIQPIIARDVFRIHQLQYTLPLNMRYEVDLWGRYQSLYESACYSAQAQVADYRVALLTLTTDLASCYYNIRTLDKSLVILKDTMDSRRQDYELNKSRHEKGLVGLIDVTSALTSFSNSESDYYEVMKQRGVQENLLATLIGVPASSFSLDPLPLNTQPPVIPAGVPSSILLRRPDIAEAERNIASQNAMVQAAYASFFPSLELTGTLGFQSPELREFLSWESRLWSIGAASHQTIFDGGSKCSNLEAACARFQEATGDYRLQVLTAFQEVENALSNLENQYAQSKSYQTSLDASNQTLFLSKRRYKEGITNYIEVIDNQRLQLNSELNYANLLGAQYQSTIQLIKALGGGWDSEF